MDKGATARKVPGIGPTSPSTDGGTGLKRLAPESSGLLKEAEEAIKVKEKAKQTEKSRRRQMLERCGC